MKAAGTSTHQLDRPIWSALTTRQQALAEGGALARRYPPAIAPFADMTDMSPESFAALGALMSGSEVAVLFTPDAVTAPAEFKILLAEAGERMKPANYTEITAVCVHPSHRGRGYGQVLLGAVASQITARGEIPFLHVFSKNDSAIALYRRQGMEIRRRLYVTVLQRQT